MAIKLVTQTRRANRLAAAPEAGRADPGDGEGAGIETRIEECLGLLRQELKKSDPQELDETLHLFRRALRRPAVRHPSAKADLVRRLSGGRTHTPAQAAALELRAGQEAFARRRAKYNF